MAARTSFTEAESQAIAEQPLLPYLLGLLPAIAGIVCLSLQWPSGHWAVQGAVTLLTAYSMLCYTSCLHETVHQTLFRRSRWNVALGRFIGMVIVVPYTAYRETHIRHHAYLNTPDDWELWPYAHPQASLAFRRTFVWVDLLLGLPAASLIYGRIFFHPKSPIQSPEVRGAIRYEYLLSALFWTVLATLLIWFDAFGVFFRAWLIPAFIAGVMQSGRKLTEHLGMSSYDPLLGTRTVIGANWLTRLCSQLNFDIFVHGPHHRYPRLPHTALVEKMREHEASHAGTKFPVFPHYVGAVRSMLSYLVVNPGCGMNAGGIPPPRRAASAADFVPDVLS
jgi:fatty acid desaturase